ncbi:unnamed protein product [Urochloa decumbens]|uniref:Amino acid transporter transmembrane domain-containing protein n=1 Tax=Urochloa decumbens TaxID=240449 RepID=A0ABC9C2X3_9POAL
MVPMEVSVEAGNAVAAEWLDDDGRPRRTGTVWTASAHIVRAVTGSGVLSLAWAIAQLGWVAGPAAMLFFSFVIYYTATLLAECYRTGDPETGTRNYTYMDAVRSNLGGAKVVFCGVIQYANLVGVAIGYTIAASISMRSIIRRANCFNEKGRGNTCKISSTPYAIIFGIAEILFSQIPNFDHIWWLSIVAAVMSFAYSSIGLGLGIALTVSNGGFKGSLTGISIGADVTSTQKMWHSLQAFGDIAFAYSFSNILIEIQDTIRAPPPSESKVMQKATRLSLATTTIFYMLCGCMGYAAFGDNAPDNLLTGFAFYEPFWLLDIANAAVVVEHVLAYRIHCQIPFAFVEEWAARRWPESAFVTGEVEVRLSSLAGGRCYKLNLFRATWRTAFVVATTVASMLLRPLFSDVVVGFLGAISFWPLTVYFPVEMYIKHKKVPRWSTRWVCLQALSLACLVITVVGAIASIASSDLWVDNNTTPVAVA